ncbi:MAG: sulfotransferase domain-containing protein [Mycobacteriaceae bacterium]
MEAGLTNKRYCTWLIDSDRWRAFQPRPTDIVVATYPKSGTTWVQRILSLLILRTEEPVGLDRLFPWWESTRQPLEQVAAGFQAQRQRRSVKTHLPIDALPVSDSIKFIHVARDGRDVCLSYHNHCAGYQPAELARMDEIGLAEPALRRPYPRVDRDPAAHFHNWLTVGAVDGDQDGTPYLSYFSYEKSFWAARKQPNVLFVHYSDLQADLTGEARRIADFIAAEFTDSDIERVAGSASFAAMRRDAAMLLPENARNFEGGAHRLLNKGQSGRWRGIYHADDLDLFESKLRSAVRGPYAEWLLAGRIDGSGIDPSQM